MFKEKLLDEQMIEIADGEVTENVVIEAKDFKGLSLKVSNYTFYGGVNFDGVDFGGGIQFINCTFKMQLGFHRCKASDYNAIFNQDSCNFFIENCNIDSLLIYAQTNFYRGIKISNKTRIRSLQINATQSSKSGGSGFILDDCEVTEQFDISDLRIPYGSFRMDNLLTGAQIRIDNVNADFCSIQGEQSAFKRDMMISKCEFGGLSISQAEFMDDVTLSAVKVNKTMTLKGGNYKRSLFVNSMDSGGGPPGGMSELYIEGCNFGTALVIDGRKSAFRLLQLTLKATISMSGSIEFYGMSVERTSISGIISNLTVSFDNVVFHELNLEVLKNYGKLVFLNCPSDEREGSFLSSRSANLGETEFQNMRFNTYPIIYISDSQWSKVESSNVVWFNDEQLITPPIMLPEFQSAKDPADALRRRKEVYRQLKHACERQGDRIQALEFKSREMQAYRKLLLGESTCWPEWSVKIYRWFKNKTHGSSDKIILWLGMTNDHGLNWIKPLCLTLVATALFYPFVLIDAAPDVHWTFEPTIAGLTRLWDLGMDNWGVYWQMLNPARRTDIMLGNLLGENGHPSALVYFLETLHRIILTFFVFQTISAFRKFVK
ncbi:MAG: hypothetical protein H6602_11035 [Flavobacteriales bacterium]|nr:hypothetical protein [Flavobacteriales bacterium]